MGELLAQRVFSIACGYADANDSARLSSDPIHKLLLDRDPVEGQNLASQPTLPRFENGIDVKELYRMGEALADSAIRRHAKRLRRRAYRVTIDLDPTDDPTHGAQHPPLELQREPNHSISPPLSLPGMNSIVRLGCTRRERKPRERSGGETAAPAECGCTKLKCP